MTDPGRHQLRAKTGHPTRLPLRCALCDRAVDRVETAISPLLSGCTTLRLLVECHGQTEELIATSAQLEALGTGRISELIAFGDDPAVLAKAPARMVGSARGDLEDRKPELTVTSRGIGAFDPSTMVKVIACEGCGGEGWRVEVSGFTTKRVPCWRCDGVQVSVSGRDDRTVAILATPVAGPPTRILEDRKPRPDEPRDLNRRPWFLTLEGRQFFYDDPESYPYSINEIATALSNLCRFAGHLARFYSVGQHSVYVARAVWREGEAMGIPWPDLAPICRAALLHDAAESFMVDLPRPAKRLPELAGYRALEDRIQLAILTRFGLQHFDAAKVIKRADALALKSEKIALRPPSPFDHVDASVDGGTWPVEPVSPEAAAEQFRQAWAFYGGAAA